MQERLIAIARLVVAYTAMTITGSLALALRVFSLGALTDFNRRHLVAASSRLILRVIGVRAHLPRARSRGREPVMYTFNHNSFLDVLIVTALGLSDTRCFLSERTLKFVPLTVSALAIGTLYIPQLKHARRRARFFTRVIERISRERFSVLVSSEGVHEFIHGIAPFNDGVYRMALASGLPVVPLYLHIPRGVNSLEGFTMKSGTVRVEELPAIDTGTWSPESIDDHVASVRALFVQRFNEAHATDGDAVAA